MSLVTSGQQADYEEAIHIDLHTTNVLVGETLHFSAFVYSTASKKGSSLSSVLYVELIDEEGKSVDRLKIGIREGRAAGHFYIGPSLESGTYRIVAFTRWMMNYKGYGEQSFLVFNPYQPSENHQVISGTPLLFDSTDLKKNLLGTFTPLENASIVLNNLQPASLSISINKATPLFYPNEISLKNSSVTLSGYEVIPEYRYGLIQGTLSKKGVPQKDSRIHVTMEGASIQVATTTSDELGRFWIPYNPSIVGTQGNLQLEDMDNVNIDLINEFYEQYPALQRSNTHLDSTSLKELIKRSIATQIQQAYQPIMRDQVKTRENFIGFDAQVYYLEDYTRFSTMRDTFIEYITNVGVSKSELDFKMIVRCELAPGQTITTYAPLILLDGIMVSAEDILRLSPNDVEKIEVLSKHFYVNDKIYKGVVSVHTLDRSNLQLSPTGINFTMAKYQSKTSQILKIENIDERLPNYQSLIYWQPIYTHLGGDLNLDFFTSGLEGFYNVSIRGISNNGRPINLNKYIRVQSESISAGR